MTLRAPGSQKRRPRPVAPDDRALESVAAPAEDQDRAFRESWRDHLLARAWDALAQAQPTYYAVLRFRTAHPELPSEELAERLGRHLSKTFTAAAARQTLHRARERFADLLLTEVAHTIEPPTPDEIEEELRDQDLLVYCEPALKRYRQGS